LLKNALILLLAALLGVSAGFAYILYSGDGQSSATNAAKADASPDEETGSKSQEKLDTGPSKSVDVAISGGNKPLLCDGKAAPVATNQEGRLFGHFPYSEPAAADLVSPPSGFGGANCQQIHMDMAGSLKSLIAAAAKDDPQVGKAIMGISCYRSVERQRGLFCNPAKLGSRGYEGQAKWIAPPGFSEHATGMTIDFGARTVPECHTNPCFKDTRTGKWLAANAGKYGFEMSFPAGNSQGVSYEPWHFRYTGSTTAAQVFGAAKAAGH
jgi:hypothetical protein